jgi:hypothetical protein
MTEKLKCYPPFHIKKLLTNIRSDPTESSDTLSEKNLKPEFKVS